MSLLYWLPMTDGIIKNQGLSAAVPAINGAVFSNNNGKLGKCVQLGANSGEIIIPHQDLLSYSGPFSVSFWINIISNPTQWATVLGITGTSASWAKEFICFQRNGDDSTYLFVVANGSSSTSNHFLTDALTLNTWYHFTLIQDSDKKMYIYQNGDLLRDYSTTITPNFAQIQNFKIGKSHTVYQGNFLINDFRFYTNALSPLEVKHLAQGLVLHYPLSDAYIESTTNLITTEDCLSPICYNAATSKYGYGTNTDIYKTVTTYDGRKGTKVYMGTNGNSCYPYVYVNNMFTSDGSNAPAYKTLSFDYYGTVGNYLGPYKLGSGEGTATYTVTCQGIKTTGTYSNFGGFTVTPNKWNHVEITFHGTTAANSEWGYIRIGNGNHASNTSNFWFFANMQLEAKDHATGYVGVGNTRTVTTVYDTSGFGNNGTINGSLTVSSDTPKYNISTYVNSSSSINHSRCLSNDNQEWTCCAWVKLDGSTSYQQLNNFNNCNMVVYGTTPILYLNGGSDDYYMYGSQVIPVDEWTHIAFVFKNSTGLRNIYINGILKNNYGPNKTSTPSGIPDIVKLFGQNFSGYVSDYREYTTALSADDVMALYKNAGYVDSDGNVYAYEMTE